MRLTQEEFDQKLQEKGLRIAFIGMSNIGKSLRTRELGTEKDFATYCVDQFIGDQLGLESEEAMARWLGHPHEEQFPENQQIYLNAEEDLTKSAPIPEDQNFVLDTTGSAIYLSDDAHNFLRENFLIVHLEAPKSLLQDMLDNFVANPRPLVWSESYQLQSDEHKDEGRKR